MYKAIFLLPLIFLSDAFAESQKQDLHAPQSIASSALEQKGEQLDIEQNITNSVKTFISNHIVNSTYAVAKKNEIFLKGAEGFYDVKSKKKLQLNNIMPLASATKSFTAVGILLLQDRGLIDVNDPISKHLPKGAKIWPNGAPPSWADKITIHHLLTHSSGLPEYVASFTPNRSKPLDALLKDLVAFIVKKPLNFQPGEKSQYINTGFVMLGLIIEAKTGSSLAKFYQKEFFQPLGMTNSFLIPMQEAFDTLDGKMTKKYPVGYFAEKDDKGVEFTKLVSVASLPKKLQVISYADGGIATNVEDLIKWNYALHHGKILSQKTYNKMITPYYDANSDTGAVQSKLGYGLYLTKMPNDIVYYHHEGRSYGLRSDCGYIPSHDLSIAILSNVVQTYSPTDPTIQKKYEKNQYTDIVDLRDSIVKVLEVSELDEE